jgi:AmmeMemoRadiSam system protein A
MSRLSNDDCRALIGLARAAIESAVVENHLPEFCQPAGLLLVPAGAFVTIRSGGQLRGCVGQVESPGPLGDTVVRAAINAALHDSRFSPVRPEEVEGLEIEISVLSPMEAIAPEAIAVGRHGLMVVKSEQRGLLLPQVAVDRHWSAGRFLEETCAKAGLPRDSWQFPSTHVFAFTAEVFCESGLCAVDRS